MARTAELYRARRAAGLCGDCGVESETARCTRCKSRMNLNRPSRATATISYKRSMIPDRRVVSRHFQGENGKTAGDNGRGLMWALMLHRERFS